MDSTRRDFCGIILFVASVALLGCGNSTSSYVRTVNGANGLTNYTVQVGQTGVAANLPYGTEGVRPKGQDTTTDTTGNYRPIAAGSNQKVIVYTTAGSSPLASETQSFLKNSYYTVVTLGTAPAITLLTVNDGDTAPSSGDFKIRLVQGAFSAGGVDVYLTAAGAPISGSPAVTNLVPGQVTAQYYSEPAGAVEAQITPTGNPSKVLFTGVLTPSAGDIYTAYFLDPNTSSPSGSNYSILLVKDPVLTASTQTGM